MAPMCGVPNICVASASCPKSLVFITALGAGSITFTVKDVGTRELLELAE